MSERWRDGYDAWKLASPPYYEGEDMDTVRVAVKVYEDGLEVAEFDIGYYNGQKYEVQIETPDGVDRGTGELVAGAES